MVEEVTARMLSAAFALWRVAMSVLPFGRMLLADALELFPNFVQTLSASPN